MTLQLAERDALMHGVADVYIRELQAASGPSMAAPWHGLTSLQTSSSSGFD